MAFAPGLTLLGAFAMATYGIDSFRVLAISAPVSQVYHSVASRSKSPPHP